MKNSVLTLGLLLAFGGTALAQTPAKPAKATTPATATTKPAAPASSAAGATPGTASPAKGAAEPAPVTLPTNFDPKIATDARASEVKAGATPAPTDKASKNKKASMDQMEIGRSQLAAGNEKDAMEYFDKAIKLMPTNAEAVLLRGQARAMRKMYPEAMADLNRAAKLLPTNADAFYWRGYVKQEQDKDKEAIVDFNKAIELKPDHAAALWGRAHSLSEMDEPDWKEKACPDFTKAAELGYEKAVKDQKKYCK